MNDGKNRNENLTLRLSSSALRFCIRTGIVLLLLLRLLVLRDLRDPQVLDDDQVLESPHCLWGRWLRSLLLFFSLSEGPAGFLLYQSSRCFESRGIRLTWASAGFPAWSCLRYFFWPSFGFNYTGLQPVSSAHESWFCMYPERIRGLDFLFINLI